MRLPPPRLIIPTVFLTGLLIQVAVLPFRGTGDVLLFKEWGVSGVSHGLLSVYAPPDPLPSTYSQPDYPPLSVTLLTAIAALIDANTGDVDPGSRTLTFYIKLMTLTAHAALAGVMLWLTRHWTGDDVKAATWALACWVNPAFVVNGPLLGYLDPLCLLIGILAMIAASMRRFAAAATLAVVAATIKPQGIFFLLPVAVAAWGSRQIPQTMMMAAATGTVILSPFVIASGPVEFASAMAPVALDETLSGNALNLWWLVTVTMNCVEYGWAVFSIPLGWIPVSDFVSATGIEPRTWMALGIAGVAAWLGWLMRGVSQLPALAAYLALVIHVYFVFAIGVHENHQVYVVALLLIAATAEPAYRRLTAMVSALVALNMLLFYGLGRDFPQVPRSGAFLLVTVALSFANIVLLAVHARLFRDTYFLTPSIVASAPQLVKSRTSKGARQTVVYRRVTRTPRWPNEAPESQNGETNGRPALASCTAFIRSDAMRGLMT